MTQKTIPPKSHPASGRQTVPRTALTGNGTSASQSNADADSATGDLTFITDEGECITFPEMGLPVPEAAAIAGEEALGKIWNRSSEDQAWRDI